MAKKPTRPAKSSTTAGRGGETHQVAKSREGVLTTNQGTAISDNQNSLRAGVRGPTMLEDFIFRERSRTSTTSVFRSGSSTLAVPALVRNRDTQVDIN